jgi:hypothetical protein
MSPGSSQRRIDACSLIQGQVEALAENVSGMAAAHLHEAAAHIERAREIVHMAAAGQEDRNG